MNRTWWTHLQTTSPIALGACTTRFSKKYPRDWRMRIQRPTEVEQYFYEMYKLELHGARSAGGSTPFGYRLTGRNYKVTRLRCYGTVEEARWAALQHAFCLVELGERQVAFAKPTLHQPVRRQPKDEKKNLPQEDWRKGMAA